MELQRYLSLFTVLIAGFVCSSEAYKFYVGGRDGWTLHPAEVYNNWSARMRFSVHDSLVFKYKNGTDSVLLVNEEDYEKCNVQNPIKKMEGGESVFIFDRPGPFYFISGNQNGTNCNQGQKLRITVLAIRPPPPSPLSPISPPSIAPSTAPTLEPTPSYPSPAIAPAMSPTSASPSSSPAIAPAMSPMSPSPASYPAIAPAMSPMSPSPAISPTYTPSISPTPEKSTLVPSPSASGNSPPADNTQASPAEAPGGSGARRIVVTPSVLAVAAVSVVLSLAFGSIRNVL